MSCSRKYLIAAASVMTAALVTGCLAFFVPGLFWMLLFFSALFPIALGLATTFVSCTVSEKKGLSHGELDDWQNNDKACVQSAKTPFAATAVYAVATALFFGILGGYFAMQTLGMYKGILGILMLVYGVSGSLAALILDGAAAIAYSLKKKSKK